MTIEVSGTPYLLELRQDQQLDELALRIKAMRQGGKLTPEVLATIRRYFRLKSIYHSNAIEGNLLDIGETRQVVELGLTLTGKPLKDQAEARNLAHALDYLESLAAGRDTPLTEGDVRQLHALVLKGINDQEAGHYRTIDVMISGSAFTPPAAHDVPPQMEEFGRWLSTVSVAGDDYATSKGITVAVAAHAWFVTIHPFVDGNGRVARLLMNLILMRYGYPIAIISKDDRARYYEALEESQSCDLSSFLGLVVESVLESLEQWEAAAAEQRQLDEWTRTLAAKFTEPQRIQAQNEYELWASAMSLLKGYFRQTADQLNRAAHGGGNVYFKDFGMIEFEKYYSLRTGESAKRTWFFRIDFRSGDKAARYLFFFGTPSPTLRRTCDVTLHISREETPFFFDRLEVLTAPNVPDLFEIGYLPQDEQFVGRYRSDVLRRDKIEHIGRDFIEEVISRHFGRA